MWKTHRIPFKPSDQICNVCYHLHPSVAIERAEKEGKLLEASEDVSTIMHRPLRGTDHHVRFKPKAGDVRIIIPISDLLITANQCPSCWMLMRGIEDISDDRDGVTSKPGSYDKYQIHIVIAMFHANGLETYLDMCKKPIEKHTVKLSLFRTPESDHRKRDIEESLLVTQLEYYTLAYDLASPFLVGHRTWDTGAMYGGLTLEGGCAHHTSNSSNSESALDLLSGWWQSCHNSHRCVPNRPVPLPPRLIHVGSKENSWAISICLSQVDIPCESVQEGYYTCLSHCWGRTRPFITTKANLEKNRQGIPWEALPKTFQDAVDITRSLGFQYVWIDSLCIVQDDADDWEKHCATMATIYRNASLVLAATASEDSQGGLFRRRSTKIQFIGENLTGNPFYTFVRRDTRHSEFQFQSGGHVRPHEDHHNRSSMPLLSRAWALQERLVSGAIVHFLDEEIIWECLEGYQCECGWSAEPNYYAPPLSWRRFLRDAEQASERRGGYVRWEDMVQAYTRRNLTFRKDLLPALSAIAERYEHSWDRWIKERPRDTYLAGLWRAELKLTMLWFTTESRKDADTDGTAPSWSWVSSPGMVVFLHTLDMIPHVDIIDAKCYPTGLNPYGEVEGGYVRVRGPLLKATIRDTSEEHHYEIQKGAHRRFFKQDNLYVFPPDNNAITPRRLDGRPVFCLKWGSWKDTVPGVELAIVALILSPIDDADPPAFLQKLATSDQVYRRVGIMHLYAPAWSEHEIESEIFII